MESVDKITLEMCMARYCGMKTTTCVHSTPHSPRWSCTAVCKKSSGLPRARCLSLTQYGLDKALGINDIKRRADFIEVARMSNKNGKICKECTFLENPGYGKGTSTVCERCVMWGSYFPKKEGGN